MEKIIPTWYYQQFDADYDLEFPGEGYGGWKQANLPINPDNPVAMKQIKAMGYGILQFYQALSMICMT